MPTETVCVHCDPPGSGRCGFCQATGKQGRAGCRDCQGSGYCGQCYGVGFEPTKREKITGGLLGIWWISWFGIISGFLFVGFWECKLWWGGPGVYFSIVLLTVTLLSWILFFVVTAKMDSRIARDRNWHSFTLLSTFAGTILAIFTLLGIVYLIFVAPRLR